MTAKFQPYSRKRRCYHLALDVHTTAASDQNPPIFIASARHPTIAISRPCKVSPRDGGDGVVRRRLYTLRLSTRNWRGSRNPPIFIPRPTTPPTPSRGLAKYRRETTMTEWWGDGCTLYGCPRETNADRKIHQYLYLGPPPHQHHLAALQNIAARQRWRSGEKTVVHVRCVSVKFLSPTDPREGSS